MEARREAPGTDREASDAHRAGSRLWPIGITIGLILVILVNVAFIYIAVSGADGVVPSYNTEPR